MCAMHFLNDLLSQEFMRRALLGGALIGFTNGFLGSFIVLRRMSLMADALSHSMLPGLALGLLFFGLSPGGLFLGGIVAAFLVAVGAMLLARGSRLKVTRRWRSFTRWRLAAGWCCCAS